MKQYDVVIIGGGAGGLSAALEVKRAGKSVLVIEREKYVGGILKQCVHDGFGLYKFRENLTGPEYVEKLLDDVKRLKIEIITSSFVSSIEKTSQFSIRFINKDGVNIVRSDSVILSTGCRERTAKQIMLQGTRPSGIFTAGACQYYINILGKMPTKKCVILGSGDIGLIMARRLTLEGATVVGVYESKNKATGLDSNISQCLNDFNIPLYTSKTVTRVFGESRLSAVEVADIVNGEIDDSSKQIVECDALILSVGLIPEIELIDNLGVHFDPHTQSALVDQTMMTNIHGLFVCGNALHNNDLVDYVAESGEIAGMGAGHYQYQHRNLINVAAGKNVSYVIPQKVDVIKEHSRVTCYFRVKDKMKNVTLTVTNKNKPIAVKKYTDTMSSGILRVIIDFSTVEGNDVVFNVEEK